MSTRNRAIVGYGSQADVGSGVSSGTRSGRSRRGRGAQDNSEEGGVGSGSHRGGASSSQTETGMSSSELAALVGTATRFVLNHQSKTVPRVEIQKFLTEDHNVSKTAFTAIMSGMATRLEETMGYQMVEVANNSFMLYNPFTLAEVDPVFGNEDDEEEEEEEEGNLTYSQNAAARRRNRRRGGGSGRRRARYNVEDNTEDESEDNEDEDEEGQELSPEELLDHIRKGLLLITLANLYMNGEPMAEADLLECLELANIDTDAKIIDLDVEEKLTVKKIVLEEFRTDNYIKRIKVTRTRDVGGTDENAASNNSSYYTLSWGLRAWIEFSPTDVVAFVRDVFRTVGGHSGPEDELRWEKVSKRLKEDEKARETLLRKGQIAFEEIIGQKRHDLDNFVVHT